MSTQPSFIIKLRGLPWNVTVEDIVAFLKDVDVCNDNKGVHLITSPKDGRPNGEAFVECSNEKAYNLAFDFNKKVMGHRYIEVFSAKQDEFEYIMKKQNVVQQDTFVKLRGLPYRVSHDEIEFFFDGLELKKDKDDSIHIVMDNRGRATGEAFVQFVSPDDTEKALKRNREKIGHRYIEIFRSSASEYRHTIHYNRPGPYDRTVNGRNSLNVTGFTRNNNRNFKGNERRGNDNRNLPSPWAIENSPWKKHSNDNFNSFNMNSGNFNNGFGPNNNHNNGFNNGTDFSNIYNSNNNGSNNFGGNRFDFSGNCGGGGGNDFNNRLNCNFTNDNYGNENKFTNRGGYDRINGNHSTAGGNDHIIKPPGCIPNGSLPNNNMNNSNWHGNNALCIHLRGMPYNCDEEDIIKFFAPVKPINATVIVNNRGLHSGEANAFFSTPNDVVQAMSKHKQKMGSRYIELFNMSNSNVTINGNNIREKKRSDSFNGNRRF